MKYLILFLFIIQSTFCHSQWFFVGDTREDVKSVLDDYKIDYSEEVFNETIRIDRISWLIENEFQMILLFNKNDIVYRQTLIPEKKNGVNEFVKWFNKDFVIISDTEWKNYSNGRIYNIKLEYIGREPLFSITANN